MFVSRNNEGFLARIGKSLVAVMAGVAVEGNGALGGI